ncbi:glycosyltransferase [bacterium]|nr:glycosyltransferase [bacterium]
MGFIGIYRHYGWRGVLSRLSRRLGAFLPGGCSEGQREEEAAQQWIAAQSHFAAEVSPSVGPRISLLCPVCDPPLRFLQEMVESVQQQSYSDWELCLVDDASRDLAVRAYLEQLVSEDDRIRVVFRSERGHITEASEDARSLAEGEYLALLDHDDLLPKHALSVLVSHLNASPKSDVFYSDEVKVSEGGELFEPAVKPRWSPIYFRGFMYTGHLTVYRRAFLESLGGFLPGYDGSQDYALLLAACERTAAIEHIPSCLYEWRSHSGSVAQKVGAKGYAFKSARRAIEEHLKRSELAFPVECRDGPYPGTTRFFASGDNLDELLCEISWSPACSREEIEQRIQAAVQPYILVSSEVGISRLQRDALRELLAPHAFRTPAGEDEVFASAPALVAQGKRSVRAVGWSRGESELLPNFSGASPLWSGSGHRLSVSFEVDAVSTCALCMRRERLLELLPKLCGETDTDHIPVSAGTLVVVPRVVVEVDQARTAASTRGEKFLVQEGESYYPTGYSAQGAHFRFSSLREVPL